MSAIQGMGQRNKSFWVVTKITQEKLAQPSFLLVHVIYLQVVMQPLSYHPHPLIPMCIMNDVLQQHGILPL